MSAQLSNFARSLSVETAFTVLAIARSLKAAGKDVVELEIGDSPFDSTAAARAGGMDAIKNNQSHYCPSPGIPEFRAAAAEFVREEFDIPAEPSNIVAGPGAKVFEQFFCEAFLNPGDGVLVFSPYFPTYLPNIERRGARAVLTPLRQANGFRPTVADIEHFLEDDPSPRAIFLNSPHNPTGGVTTQDDLKRIADVVRGRDVAVFSDEPYCHMVWRGSHHSILSQPGMLAQCVGAYTFSKSYSMSGWRLGFAVASVEVAEVDRQDDQHDAVVHTADRAARRHRGAEARQERARRGHAEVPREGRAAHGRPEPHRRLQRAGSHGARSTSFRMSRASATGSASRATDWRCSCCKVPTTKFGIACLGGECFGQAGAGFLRFSCAEPNDRLQQALDFIPKAIARTDRLAAWLDKHPQHRLAKPYAVE